MNRLIILVVATIGLVCTGGMAIAHKQATHAHTVAGHDNTVSCPPKQCPPGAEWVAPVPHGVVSQFRGPRPDHDGIDLGSPTGTPVRAASAGVVSLADCQATLNESWYGCDRDGSPQVQGCGWHVTIVHADDTMTVYCHLVTEPDVDEGDRVEAGDVIGTSGSSGNSSGPHLHLETHTDTTWRSASAIDPAVFFSERGVQL